MDLTTELIKYKDLLDRGIITPEEYERKKAQLLAGSAPIASGQSPTPYATQTAYTAQPAYVAQPAQADTGSAGWAVLGFFIPLVGLILYLVWSSTRPMDAKQAGKGALVSVIVAVALSILFGFLVLVLSSL